MPRASFANVFPPDASCLEAPHPSCGTQIMTLIREARGGWAGGQHPGGWTGAPEDGMPRASFSNGFPFDASCLDAPPPFVRRRLQHSFAKSAAAGRAGSSPAAVLSTSLVASERSVLRTQTSQNGTERAPTKKVEFPEYLWGGGVLEGAAAPLRKCRQPPRTPPSHEAAPFQAARFKNAARTQPEHWNLEPVSQGD